MNLMDVVEKGFPNLDINHAYFGAAKLVVGPVYGQLAGAEPLLNKGGTIAAGFGWPARSGWEDVRLGQQFLLGIGWLEPKERLEGEQLAV